MSTTDSEISDALVSKGKLQEVGWEEGGEG